MTDEHKSSKQRLRCRFKRGDRVAWNTIASGRMRGWLVERVEERKGLQPIYRLKRGDEIGSAVQWDLEIDP